MARVSDDLLAREEEYIRINEEIEQRTKLLVEEVANISVEQQISRADQSASSPCLNPHSPDNIFREAHTKSSSSLLRDNLQDHSNPLPDVLPADACDLGVEATVRLLKAKVRVLEEEVDRLTLENNQQRQSISKSKQNMASEKDERMKLQKQNQTLQNQVEKYSNLAEEKKKQNKIMETEIGKLKKDVDAMTRAEKKSGQSQKTMEVRLDRAVEEGEKFKSLLGAERARSSENTHMDKETFNAISNENKILEKQKTELINAYKKQMKLIDVLRKQKLHLEASRMLNFTQEEFIKVLDWKNAQ